jgi:hypothetical protein
MFGRGKPVNRRTFLTGIAGMLVAKQAAAVIPSGY